MADFNGDKKRMILVYTTAPHHEPGLMLLGTGDMSFDEMKLLLSDDAWSDVEEDGELVGEMYDLQLLDEFGLRVISPWRYEIEFFEADCEIVAPSEANSLMTP